MDKFDISRRSFAAKMGGALAASATLAPAGAQQKPASSPRPVEAARSNGVATRKAGGLQVGMLLFPGLTALDLVGPQPFLEALEDSHVHLLWKDKEPVASGNGYSIVPTMAIRDCPRDLDILFVPGGATGTIAMMEDDDILGFLADRGSRARYVTSVCTGSLILGAAGLLEGYKATSHWRFRDLLPLFGAAPVEERVVIDRNRITGGGVTAGIDFGLVIASVLGGREKAEAMQLATEYDPYPPFRSGSPRTAPASVKSSVYNALTPAYEGMRSAGEDARRRRNLS